MSPQFFFLNHDEEVVGILNDALKCKVHERTYQADFTFENSDVFSFEDCAYVGFVDINADLVFYEIIDMNPTMDGVTNITAEHAAMTELLQEIVEGRAVTEAEAGFAVQTVLANTRWTMRSAQPTPQMSTTFWYKNVWECLEIIRKSTECALYFGWTIVAGKISERYVTVKARAGANRGKRFDLSKDLKHIDVHVDKSCIYTLLYGRGKGEEVGTNVNGDPTYGRRITIADVEWSVANGDPMSKPIGVEYLEDVEATHQFGRGISGEKRPRKGVVTFEDCTDPAELIQLTYNKLQTVRHPKLTISGKVIDLERVWGYSHEAVRIGDDVIVIADEWKATYQDVIVDIVRDYLNPMDTEVTIGEEGKTTYSIQSDLTSEIEKVKEKAEIGSSVAAANPALLRGIIDTMATQIMSSGTGIATDPNDGSLIFTSADGQSAVKITGAGILVANTRIADAWVWRTAITGGGVATEELTAGVLNASLIKILGTDQFYWDSSNIYIQNPANTQQQIRIGRYDGVDYGIAWTSDGGATWSTAINFDGINGEKINLSSNTTIKLMAEEIDASVARVDVEYYQSDSATSLSGGNWSTTAPPWQAGKYMWSRTTTILSNGTVSHSNVTCIAGAAGKDGTGVTILGSYDSFAALQAAHPTGAKGDAYIVGEDLYVWSDNSSAWSNVGKIKGDDGLNGIGVTAIVEQYYVSTSKTSLVGGSWSTNQSPLTVGTYLWTRSSISWSDGKTTTTEAVLAQAINGANDAAFNAQTAAGEAKTDVASLKTYVSIESDGLYVKAAVNTGIKTRVSSGSFDVIDENGAVTTSMRRKQQKIGGLLIFETVDGDIALTRSE